MQATVGKHDISTTGAPKFSPMDRAEFPEAVTTGAKRRPARIPDPPPRPSKLVAVAAKATVAAKGPSPLPPPPPPSIGASKFSSPLPPPPPPSVGASKVPSPLPPPPPPLKGAAKAPPPPSFSKKMPASLEKSGSKLRRAPQVVEMYNTLMKREPRKDSSSKGGASESADMKNAHNNMIDEMANKSSYYHAVIDDVETQGDFVRALIKEVNNAVFPTIEDVVAFVKWLDKELSYLVDERAVLKHFEWPEKKSDALREAAFGYLDLKKLEAEVASFHDDPRVPIEESLQKMTKLAEKAEHDLYKFLRNRDILLRQCKEFQMPTSWMLDTGVPSEVKMASVKLARIYMNRVVRGLQAMEASGRVSKSGPLVLQGVRFAFKVHQLAGGFDVETIQVFEELRKFIYTHVYKDPH